MLNTCRETYDIRFLLYSISLSISHNITLIILKKIFLYNPVKKILELIFLIILSLLQLLNLLRLLHPFLICKLPIVDVVIMVWLQCNTPCLSYWCWLYPACLEESGISVQMSAKHGRADTSSAYVSAPQTPSSMSKHCGTSEIKVCVLWNVYSNKPIILLS